eukprot:1233740-Alexandrium_andersonii.AAC.1
MSASLVGSEMCIRDRSSNPRSAISFAIGAREASESSKTPQNPRKSPQTCLLYTSDAADDM